MDHSALKRIEQAITEKANKYAEIERARKEAERIAELERVKQQTERKQRIEAEWPERMKMANEIWEWISQFRQTPLCQQLFDKHQYIVIFRTHLDSWYHYDIFRYDTAIHYRVFAKWAGTITNSTYRTAQDLAQGIELQDLRSFLHSLRPGGEVYDQLQRQALN